MTSKHDHLGSARITLDNAARVIESQSYTAYGDHRTHDGEASRTSYIGRETPPPAPPLSRVRGGRGVYQILYALRIAEKKALSDKSLRKRRSIGAGLPTG